MPIDYSAMCRPCGCARRTCSAARPPAGRRVPVKLELPLPPADPPIQVTQDLPGFWAGSWAEVRKEMAGRYPKHHWPVDPAAAPPKRLKPQ